MLKYCSKTNDSMDMGFFNHRKTQFNSNDTNQGPEDTLRYPPTSTPPTELQELKKSVKNLTKEMHP